VYTISLWLAQKIVNKNSPREVYLETVCVHGASDVLQPERFLQLELHQRSFLWFSIWEHSSPFGPSAASPYCELLEKMEDKVGTTKRNSSSRTSNGFEREKFGDIFCFGEKYSSCSSPHLVFHVSPLVKNIFKWYWAEVSQFLRLLPDGCLLL